MSDQQPHSSGLSRLRKRMVGREETRPPSPEAVAIHARVDQLSELELRDVMTPRVDVAFLQTPVTPEAMAEAIRDTGHSCFPVVNGDLDEVQGVLSGSFYNPAERREKASRVDQAKPQHYKV
ncbi:MAG: hypothetical protein ABI298_06235, partial [Acidimicrobiales bacterium]